MDSRASIAHRTITGACAANVACFQVPAWSVNFYFSSDEKAIVCLSFRANFIHRNPTIALLALGFLLLIGAALIAGGFGFHFPKGYIYAAMAYPRGQGPQRARQTHSQTTAEMKWQRAATPL
jgi:hypothetical protein